MAFYYADKFFLLPRPLCPQAVLDELEIQLLKLVPNWVRFIIRKWPNNYLAYMLTGIKIFFITRSDKPGKMTIEIWKNFKLQTSIEYTKETYITEINKDKIKLENVAL